MTDTRDIKWAAGGQAEVLTFDLNGETFAFEATLVQEILDLVPETVVPGSIPLVGSVINFRGRVIPLADLRLAFNLTRATSTSDSRIIVIELDLEGEASLIGLKADKVHEVTTLEMTSTESAPRIGMKWRPEFIRRLAKHKGDLIVVPHLENIFVAQNCKEKSPTSHVSTPR